MAQALGIRTLAEGVETAEQLAFLREQGCDEAQGYFFSQPLPAQAFGDYVRRADGMQEAPASAVPLGVAGLPGVR